MAVMPGRCSGPSLLKDITVDEKASSLVTEPTTTGPCAQKGSTSAWQQSLCRYFGHKVYTIWARAPSRKEGGFTSSSSQMLRQSFMVLQSSGLFGNKTLNPNRPEVQDFCGA